MRPGGGKRRVSGDLDRVATCASEIATCHGIRHETSQAITPSDIATRCCGATWPATRAAAPILHAPPEPVNSATMADTGRLVIINAGLRLDNVPALLTAASKRSFAAVPPDARLQGVPPGQFAVPRRDTAL